MKLLLVLECVMAWRNPTPHGVLLLILACMASCMALAAVGCPASAEELAGVAVEQWFKALPVPADRIAAASWEACVDSGAAVEQWSEVPARGVSVPDRMAAAAWAA